LRCFNNNCKKSASSTNFDKFAISTKYIIIVTLKYLQLDFALNYIEQTY